MALTLSQEDIQAIGDYVYDKILEGQNNSTDYDEEGTISPPQDQAGREKIFFGVIRNLGEDQESAGNMNAQDLLETFAPECINQNTLASQNIQTMQAIQTDVTSKNNNVITLASQVTQDKSTINGYKEAAESAKDAAQQAEDAAEASKTAATSSATSAASSKSAAEAAEGNVSTMKGQIETLKAQIEDIAQSKNVLPVLIDGEVKGLSIIANASGVMIDLSDIEESGATETA